MGEIGLGLQASRVYGASSAGQMDELSPERKADEAVMLEVAGALSAIEDAIRQSERALAAAKANPRQAQVFFALERNITQLRAAHKKLFQDAYFGVGEGSQDSLF